MSGLTHIDRNGNAVMVDVGGKAETLRIAVAKGRIRMSAETFETIRTGAAKKGDVMLTKCTVDFELLPETLEVEAACAVQLTGRTGVEMEALTGASVALLTIYDMCKAIDRGMVLGDIRLIHKEGGKSGVFDR